MKKKETSLDPERVLHEKFQRTKPIPMIRKQFGILFCVALFLLAANQFKDTVITGTLNVSGITTLEDDVSIGGNDIDMDAGNILSAIDVQTDSISDTSGGDITITPGGGQAVAVVGALNVSGTHTVDGGLIQIRAASNPSLTLEPTNLNFSANQQSAFGVGADSTLTLKPPSNNTGGAWLLSANKAAASGLAAYYQSLSENDLTTWASHYFNTGKHDGAGSLTDHGASAKLFVVANNGTVVWTVLGNGKGTLLGDLQIDGGDLTTPGGVDLTIAPGGGDLQLDAQVGIGIADPAVELVVFNTVPRIQLQTSGSGTTTTDGFQIAMDASQVAFLFNFENARLSFGTDGDEHMRLFASGGVGIGNSTFPTDPGAGGLNTDGVVRFGGGGATNYTQWAADGMQTMVGDARVHGHMNFPATRVKKGGVADPTEVILDGFNFVLSFDPATDKEVFGQAHIPSDYEMGTDLHLHFHWAPSDGNAGNVTWGVEWLITTDNVNDSIVTGEVTQIVVDATESLQDEHLLSDTITIDGTGVGKSDLMHFRVFRDANASEGGASDTYAANAYLINVSVEYIRDSLGEDGVW